MEPEHLRTRTYVHNLQQIASEILCTCLVQYCNARLVHASAVDRGVDIDRWISCWQVVSTSELFSTFSVRDVSAWAHWDWMGAGTCAGYGRGLSIDSSAPLHLKNTEGRFCISAHPNPRSH